MTLRGCSIITAMAALCLYGTVSCNLLTDLGDRYVSEGGSIFEKIHPASYLAIFSGVLRLAAGAHGMAGPRRLLHENRPAGVFMLCIAFCVAYAFTFTGPGGVIALLDTFLPAGMLALAFADAGETTLRRLRTLLQCLLALNACLALAEAALQAHLIHLPAEFADANRDFRPLALYDHPLTGATATMLGWLLRPDCARKPIASIAYQALMLAALLAFGERMPLALGLCAAVALASAAPIDQILGRRITAANLALILLLPTAAMALVAGALAAGLGPRLEAHLYWDASAGARLSVFQIFGQLDTPELLFGIRREDLIALIEPMRLATNVGVIENFWLVMLLTLGALCFPVFAIGLAALLRGLWRQGDAQGRAMVWVLLAAASGSNSLGRKSMLLVLLTACVMATRCSPAVRFRSPVMLRPARIAA